MQKTSNKERRIKKMNETQGLKSKNGITLIALVITIIVLLILAGVTIAMLTGENGILTQANNAKTKTEEAKEDELRKLTQIEAASHLEEYEYEDKSKQQIKIPANCAVSQVDGENSLEDGLVIIDKNGNEWVWIEVLKSVTASANTDEEIKNALVDYVGKDVYRQDGYDDTYQSGLGIDEQTYNSNYSAMLQSIKANGGFWIGRYEMGLESDTPRTEETKDNLTGKALSQADKIPYNWITVSQAQELAQEMNPDESKNISSIMYGIQWDLVCKYIESKEQYTKDGTNTLIDQSLINSNSTKWGNYLNATFEIKKGKFSEDSEKIFDTVNESYTKIQDKNVLLTTGATERNSVLNIYDFAGNEWEWTLEKSINSDYPCVRRGGYYNSNGNSNPASYHYYHNTSYTFYSTSSRSTLFNKFDS